MRAAQWTALIFLVTISALYLIRFLTGSSQGAEDPRRPDLGNLAPIMTPLPKQLERARFTPEGGDLVDLAVRGDRMAILGRDGWLYSSEDSSRGWFGDHTPGSPDWIDRPISIALGESEVFILDGRRSLISVWDTLGTRTGDLSLPISSTLAYRPTKVLLGPKGHPLVVVQRIDMDGTASWDIVAFDSLGSASSLVSIPNQAETMIFQEPLLSVSGSTLMSMDPLTQGLSSVDPASGRVTSVAQRGDPPFWLVPHRHVRSYKQLLGRMGGPMAQLSALPEFWPSVRDFTIRDDGSLLLTVTATEDRWHVEYLDPGATPLARFNLDGFVQPLFLSDGRAFIAEEGINETVIYEFVF